MKLESIVVSKINPAQYNPRKNLQPDDLEYKKLLRSINEFDCVQPLVWNRRTGNLVGGHQRLKILIARGDKEVLCSIVDLPPEKEKALNLALNKISGAWDEDKLAVLLDELITVPDFDVEVTGFDLPEVSQIIDSLLHSDSDEFDIESELAKITKPKTKPGEIIKLGPHRLLCGDSTKVKDMQKLMGDKQAQLIFTDPPYAVNYRGGAVGKDCTKGKLKKGKKHWDDMTATNYEQLLVKSLSNSYELSDGKAALYIWFASSRIDSVIKSLKAARWEK